MRIIAGEFRSRVLKSPKDEGCRPAMGRTREALFSMLDARGVEWANVSVLDLFAGTGSLAFEAASRGARQLCLVENALGMQKCIEANARLLGIIERVRCIKEDVLRYVRNDADQRYGLVFLDPPYRKKYVNQILDFLCHKGWLENHAYVSCEIEVEYTLNLPKPLVLETERVFGQTKIALCHYQLPRPKDVES
ncbi:MAG: RsmD family RNA methyltransferase [Desulfovibrio sp.]|nr:RsmD family RNA methyltransferase [Desulfovibrio sp.]